MKSKQVIQEKLNLVKTDIKSPGLSIEAQDILQGWQDALEFVLEDNEKSSEKTDGKVIIDSDIIDLSKVYSMSPAEYVVPDIDDTEIVVLFSKKPPKTVKDIVDAANKHRYAQGFLCIRITLTFYGGEKYYIPLETCLYIYSEDISISERENHIKMTERYVYPKDYKKEVKLEEFRLLTQQMKRMNSLRQKLFKIWSENQLELPTFSTNLYTLMYKNSNKFG